MIELMSHQKQARDIARRCPRFAFFHDCGTGKTMSVLAICDERRMPTLVLCPRSIIDAAWLKDASHFASLKVISGRANSANRRRGIILGRSYDIIALNYESAKLHVDDFLKAGIRRLVIGESSALKNHRSQTTLACLHLSQHMDEVYLLSGTPAPNGAHEYWAQLMCVHPGRTARNY